MHLSVIVILNLFQIMYIAFSIHLRNCMNAQIEWTSISIYLFFFDQEQREKERCEMLAYMLFIAKFKHETGKCTYFSHSKSAALYAMNVDNDIQIKYIISMREQ